MIQQYFPVFGTNSYKFGVRSWSGNDESTAEGATPLLSRGVLPSSLGRFIQPIDQSLVSPTRAELGSRRNVQRFQGGLVFKAHRLLYHSTLGLSVIKKKRRSGVCSVGPGLSGLRVEVLGFRDEG